MQTGYVPGGRLRKRLPPTDGKVKIKLGMRHMLDRGMVGQHRGFFALLSQAIKHLMRQLLALGRGVQ